MAWRSRLGRKAWSKATARDTSVAAQVITGKFGYHLPIYRQQDYFAGSD